MVRRSSVLVVGAAVGLVAGALSSCLQDGASCRSGTLDCSCDPSGTCEGALLCRQNRCVAPDDDPTVAGGTSSDGDPSETSDGIASTTGVDVECNGATFRVAVYNVQAVGFAGTDEWDALGEIIRRLDADVVCIQELGDSETSTLRDLAEALGYAEPVQADMSPGIGGELRNACVGRVPLSRIDSFTASDLSSDPSANDVGRDILAVRVGPIGGCHASVISLHAKSGQEPIDWFRRQVEFQRVAQALAEVESRFPDDPVMLMGDFNENLDDPAIGTVFDAPPAGLPESFELGDDIEFPLVYSPFATVQSAGLAMVDATQEDSEWRETWAAFDDGEGVRLDYLWIDDAALTVEAAVAFNTCKDDGMDAAPVGAFLPLAGEPLPCWVGPAASDHLPIVADLRIP